VRYLLDTSTFLLFAQEPDRLSTEALALISDQGHDFYLSAASAWEVAIKQGIGKFPTLYDPVKSAHDYGFSWLPVTQAVYQTLKSLPLHHRDPFDRLIISHAIHENCILISTDREFSRYPLSVLYAAR
jgi:PIN domain nuclease of toxin-antitoxin system